MRCHLKFLEDVFARARLHEHDWGAGLENGHLMVLWLDIKDLRRPTSYKGREEVVELLLNDVADSFNADRE
jgi:hypothetical protein